jgi:hypothetical protein
MTITSTRARLAPWAGLVAGPLCWALHQQGLADMLHFDCHLGSASKGFVSGSIAAIVLVAAGIVSWRSREGAVEWRQFVAAMSACSVAIFLFAIVLQTMATFILPGCGS